MASIGLRRFRYGLMNEDEETYGQVGTLAGAIECKVSLNIANAKLHADDVTKENIDEFIDGTITMGIDDDDDEKFSVLLGEQSENYTTGEGTSAKTVKVYKSNTNDIAKYFGFGQVVPKIISGSRKYKVEWFPKVQFKPFVVDKKTKGDSLEFTTPSVEGTIFADNNGDWRKRATFDTEEEANTFLDSLFVQTA